MDPPTPSSPLRLCLIAGLAALMWWCFPAVDRDYLTVSVGEGTLASNATADMIWPDWQ